MRLSVVTITFNNAEELLQTIESLKEARTRAPIEHVIVNGGSCEQTRDYLLHHGEVFVSEPDRGISDAFNKGAHLASGDAIVFLNSGDTLIDPDYYAWALTVFQNNPDVGFVYADIIGRHRLYGDIRVPAGQNHGAFRMPFPHPSLIVRKSVFERVGGFDLKYRIAMDYDFVQRMLMLKINGMYYDRFPVVLMDGRGVSSTRGALGVEERLKILKDLNLLTGEAYRKAFVLKLKMMTRSFLGKIKLLGVYDRIKMQFGMKRSE